MKTKAIATIVITLFLVSVGIAFTACSEEPKASNEPGENAEVRAELRVDPNGFAAAIGAHPKDLDDLKLALLSSGIEEWSLLEDTVSIDLIAGSHAVSLPVQQHSRMRDLNGDGIEDHLLEVDLAAGHEAHRELSGFHGTTVRVRYVSRVRFVPASTVSESLTSAAVATNSSSLLDHIRIGRPHKRHLACDGWQLTLVHHDGRGCRGAA